MKKIILILSLLCGSAQAQYCTISDTLKAPDGTALANSPVYVSRVYLGSQPINLGTYRHLSNAAGIVSFSIFQGATAYIQCNYMTFNVSGGVQVTIPSSSTALLRNLAPASNTVSTNAGFVRIREADGSPTYAVTGNNDTLEVENGTLTNPSTNIYRLSAKAPIQFTADSLGLSADTLWFWQNTVGDTVTIDSIYVDASADNFGITFFERNPTGGNVKTVDAVTASSNGTNTYYARETTITHATIERLNWLGFKKPTTAGKRVSFRIHYH